jgi:hypothetical protein
MLNSEPTSRACGYDFPSRKEARQLLSPYMLVPPYSISLEENRTDNYRSPANRESAKSLPNSKGFDEGRGNIEITQ